MCETRHDSAQAKDAPPDAACCGGAEQGKRDWTALHLWQLQPIRDCLWIAMAVFVLWAGYVLRSVFTPVLIALALAYVANPLVDFAQRRWRLPRPVAIVLSIGMAILTLVALVSWLGPLLIDQITAFVQSAPEYLKRLGERGLGRSDEQFRALAEQIQAKPLDAVGAMVSGTSRAFGFVGDVVSATVYFVVSTLLIPIYFFMFSWRFHSMLRRLEYFVPKNQHERVVGVAGQMDRAVSTFFRARVTIAIIASIFYVLGWSPLLTDVPYWLLLGLLTGVLSLIPYAAGGGWLIALLLRFLEMSFADDVSLGQWILGLGGPTIIFLLGQFLESWILTPWIQGASLDLNAVTVLIAVLVGGTVGGLYGLILAVPVTACGKILLKELVLPRLSAWTRGNR